VKAQLKSSDEELGQRVAQPEPELTPANQELKNSEVESRLIVDSIPGLVAVLTPTGDVEMVSRQVLEYFGRTLEELRQWKTDNVVHPEDLPQVIEVFTGSIASGSPYEIVQRFRRSDGVYHWFENRGFPLRDPDGQIIRWCVLFADIDDQKRAEDALRASERNLKLIIDTIPAVAWSARTDGSADFFSQQYLDYVGRSLEQMKNWGWTAAVHPDDLAGLAAKWQRVMASGQAGEAEARLRRFDGAYRWFLFRANPLRDESRKIVKWFGTIIDIEDRKRGEEALRVKEVSWRQIVDNIPGLVVTMTAGGEVEFLNRQTLEYFGKTNEELKNWALIDAVHPDDLPRVIEARTKAIETGHIYDVEHRCRRADGIYRWFQVRGLPVRDAEGTISAWYLLLTDIDARKKAEEALQSSERNSNLTISAIPIHIHVLRTDGSVLYVNQAVLDYTGLTLEDVQKESYRACVFHPEDVERLREERRQALARPVPFENEQRALNKDGRYRWFAVRYNPLLDEQGRIDRWYCAAFDIEDRKRAEAERKQAYFQLSEAQRLSKTGSFISDLLVDDFNFSEEALRIFEFDAGTKVTLQMIRDRIHPEDLPSVDADIARTTSCADFDNVYRIVTSPGVVKHVHSTAHVIQQIEGRPIFCCAVQDVTEIKLAEEALRASERNLNQIINVIPSFIAVLGTDGSISYVNQVALDYTGLSLEDVQKESFRARLVHPEDVERLREERRQALTRAVPFENEQRALAKDGRYRWFLMRYNPLLDEQGRIDRWYCSGFDIEDRKRAEDELRRAYNSFADAQRLSKTGSFITDLVGDDHNWSEEAYRIFEFDPGTKVSVQRVHDVIYPEDLPMFEAMIARAMTGVHVNFTFRIVTARGALKHVHGVAHVIEQVEGRPVFVGALQDVTDSKVAEEALDKARSELAHVTRVTTLNALTASIAHEVNQPLSGIVSNGSACLRWLANDVPDLDEIREAVGDIVRDGKRAAEVIARIRALATKRTAVPREKLDLNETIREVLAIVGDEAKRKSVTIRTRFADDVLPIFGDRVQLQQVVLNLIMNGFEAISGVSERARELVITTGNVDAAQVRVTVEDSGTGLDPNTIERIFDPFYTTKPAGMGMGLSISRSILQQHGGRLWAAPNDGPGTSFHFTLPKYEQEQHVGVAGF
jgi:PAS domain S-box-containing protein